MGFTYRWARGEEKAQELAEKVSGYSEWRRIENTAKCGNVTCHKYDYMLDGDSYYKDYWICYQHTSDSPANPEKWRTTIGWCCDGDFPDLPKKRLKDGIEKIYR